MLSGLVLIAVVSSSRLSRAQLTEPEVTTAVAEGTKGQKLEAECSGTANLAGWHEDQAILEVIAEGPVGRIMRAAREAKSEHRAFSNADVTAEMSARVLTVRATLITPFGSDPPNPVDFIRGLSPLRTIGLQVEDRVLNPLRRPVPGLEPAEIVAVFDLDAVRRDPREDLVAVVSSAAGQRTCKIGAKNKMSLR